MYKILRKNLLWNFFFNYPHYCILKTLKNIPDKLGIKILDVGAGDSYVGDFFTKSEYVSQDNTISKNYGYDYSKIDITEDIHEVNNKNEYFDYVLLLNVLEHTYNPKKHLLKIREFLKKDGILIMYTPFLTPVHLSPYDYYRYTIHFYEKFCEKENLTINNIKEVGGFYIFIIDSIKQKLNSNFFSKLIRYLFILPLEIILTPMFLLFDRLNINKDFCVGYIVEIKK